MKIEKLYNLTDAGDSSEKYYGIDNLTNDQRIITAFDNSEVLKQNAEDRKSDGFSIDHNFRLVAHIDMNTVKLLALNNHDADAKDYLDYHDADARDRMIRRYPEYFKACSGGV